MVFDGSGNAQDTFLVSLTGQSLRLDLGSGGGSCGAGDPTPPEGVVSVDLTNNVAAADDGVGTSLTTHFLSQPHLAQLELISMHDDCELAADPSAALTALATAVTTVENAVAGVDSCLAQCDAIFCDIVATLGSLPQNAEGTFVRVGPLDVAAEASGGRSLYEETCDVFLVRLRTDLPEMVTAATAALASCEDALSHLQLLQSAVATLTETNPSSRYHVLAWAGLRRSAAENAAARVHGLLQGVYDLQAELTPAALGSSCADCPKETGPVNHRSVAVSLKQDASPLQPVAAAFQTAAAAESDPDLADRYLAIATRMLAIPVPRVLHVRHPAETRVGTTFVGLLAEGEPDDGASPLAVVIGGEVTPRRMSFADERILSEAWRSFFRVIDPGFAPPEDEDDDDDRLRDAHETDTGQTVSFEDTGSNPTRHDSDGDFFWDGTEIDLGADPNDPTSVPEVWPARLPTLSWGLPGLILTLLGLASVMARRRR